MTKQLDIWTSQFGKDWTDRTNIDPRTRADAFKRMIGGLDIRTILEVGCSAGHNLAALSLIQPPPHGYELYGVDPLEYAIVKANQECRPYRKAWTNFLVADCFHLPFVDSAFDLVFTCGVLMHTTPEDLPKAIREMSRVSNRYILLIEYYAEDEVSIPYRGHDDLLFKRDYRKAGERMGLKCIEKGFWGKEDGFDDCSVWLFGK